MLAHDSNLDFKNDSTAIILKEVSTEVCFCDLIYKAAKNPNKYEAKLAISEILKSASINVLHATTNDTAISKLAAEDDSDSVNFLMKEFNASFLWALYGYALGGHVAEVNKNLRLLHNPDTRLIMYSEVICGYAHGGHVLEANKVLALAKTPDERFEWCKQMAYGYALGGHVIEANKVLAQNLTERLSILEYMMSGYALGGYVLEANAILALTIPDEQLKLWEKMVRGFARRGLIAEVNKVLAFARDSNEQLALRTQAISGYALSGRASEARKILTLTNNAYKQRVMRGAKMHYYAEGGHVKEANRVLAAAFYFERCELLKHMGCGYAINYDVMNANEALELAIDANERRNLSKIIVKNLDKIIFLNERNALQTLSTFNPDYQHIIAFELKKLDENKVDVVHLVPKAKQLHRIMEKHDLNFDQAMGWIQPEMQIWLLQGIQLINNGRLPEDIFLRIATFLSPSTDADMVSLGNSLFCDKHKKRRLIHNEDLLSVSLTKPSVPTII